MKLSSSHFGTVFFLLVGIHGLRRLWSKQDLFTFILWHNLLIQPSLVEVYRNTQSLLIHQRVVCVWQILSVQPLIGWHGWLHGLFLPISSWWGRWRDMMVTDGPFSRHFRGICAGVWAGRWRQGAPIAVTSSQLKKCPAAPFANYFSFSNSPSSSLPSPTSCSAFPSSSCLFSP